MSFSSPALRAGLRAGLHASIPMAVGSFPFGVAYGVSVTAAGVDPWLGASASWTVLAGAAQLSMLSLVHAKAPPAVVVLTALVVNLRFALYSVALAPGFAAFPAGWRYALPYLMTDQAAALSLQYFADTPDPDARRGYYLGVGLGVAATWWAGTIVGVTLGGAIPPTLDVAFTVPLVFVVLLVPALADRASIVAAVAAAMTTVFAARMPHGLNTVAGAAVGVLIGALLDRERRA